MAISKIFSIRNFAIKRLMKTGDDGIMRMPSQMKADFAEAMLTKQLIDAGIDPRTIKNEQQLINVLDSIDNMKKMQTKADARKIEKSKEGIKSAKIFDLEGKEIPQGSKIMGGKGLDSIFNEMYGDFKKDKLKFMRGDDTPPPGSGGGKDDIAAPVQSAEETIKNMIEAENKKNIAKIKNRKMIEEAIDNVSPGFVQGDNKYNAEIVAEEIATKRGLDYYDMDTKKRADIYGEAYDALMKKMRDESDFAGGGMLVQPSMTGKRPGYRGDAAAKSSGAAASGRVGGSDVGESSTKSDPRDDGPDDRSTFEQTMNQRNIVDRSKQPKESILKNLYNTGQDINYLKNLIMGNFPAIGRQLMLEYGRKKLFDDQSMLDQEGIINGLPENQFAELSKTQLNFLNSPKIQRDLKEFGREPKAIFDQLPKYEERRPTLFNPLKKQEPTTPQEFNEYLDSIGVKRMTAADGGRIGLKDGMDRRTFMKVMAGLASIPVVGKFFKGAKVASKAAPVAMESATRSEPPTYFLKLVDKITKQGKPTTSTEDIMETYIYTAKNGDTYELVNDLKTGDLRITKDKTGIGTYGDKSFDTIEDRTIMEYKAPRQDVDVETGRGTREAPEYEEYKVEFDQDGTEAGAEAIEETIQKEIIEESAEEAPSIKKADGGRVGLNTGSGLPLDPMDPDNKLNEVINAFKKLPPGTQNRLGFKRFFEIYAKENFATGGRVGLLSGGGILRTILTNLAKDKGMKPSDYLRLTNYKSLPDSTKRIISKDEFLKLKADMTEKRIELMDTVKNMIVTRQGFEKSKDDLRKSMNMASEGYGDKAVKMMFPEDKFPSPVPAGSGQKDVMMMEQLIKNLKTKDRQLNASGGVAYMLGE